MPRATIKATAEFHYLSFDRYPVSASFLSDRGPTRANNEDSATVIVPDRDALAQKGILAVVADGMGGHEGGEIASNLAVDYIARSYYASSESPQEALVTAFQGANRAIFDRARKEPKLAGMGTTCTAVAVISGVAWAAHVGDSRVYLVRGGETYRMTEDHSATMQLVNKGVITLAEAAHHEDRNVITRAMGTHDKLEVSCWKDPFPLQPDDRFVLCSDGLYETISDREIAEVAARARQPERACADLIALATRRECSDNVTVAVLHVGRAEPA
ncbi:MAG: Stp1/IreP family PP2C-type Ser/Thr phosphatase [Bryobacteraceae bacterium]